MQRTNSTLIKLCPRSPDLACVENLFHMVGKILQDQAIERNLRRETFEEFQTRVINTFYSIPVETVNTLIRTMPKRIDMVIQKKGARINLVPSPVLAPLSVTQRSALAQRGSRDNCLRMLVILASFLANRYCACTTR